VWLLLSQLLMLQTTRMKANDGHTLFCSQVSTSYNKTHFGRCLLRPYSSMLCRDVSSCGLRSKPTMSLIWKNHHHHHHHHHHHCHCCGHHHHH
jgi:hypothetical protein